MEILLWIYNKWLKSCFDGCGFRTFDSATKQLFNIVLLKGVNTWVEQVV